MASHSSTHRHELTEERSTTLDRLLQKARRLAPPTRRERLLIKAVLHKEAELAEALRRAQQDEPAPAGQPPLELVMALREPKGKQRYVAVVVDGIPVSLVVNPRGECNPSRELATWQWLEERVRRGAA